MIVIKADENWYRAEQTIENGVLTYTVKAYGTTPEEAEKILKEREFTTNTNSNDRHY